MKVLISGPNIYDARVYLPTTFLNLKTYIECQTDIKNVQWLDPLFRNRPLEQMVAGIDFRDVDVLGLSCYEWNWQLNTQIANHAKKINPSINVIAGGPHPDYKNPKFWDKYPMIDSVVHHDGEKAFASLLKGDKNAPGTATRDGIGPISLLEDFRSSPWLHNKEWLLEFKKKHVDHPDTKAGVVMWETDRGCPYQCTFCDWGSLTYNKIKKFELDRVFDELEWIGKNKCGFLSITNANFGIFPERDNLIADKIIEVQNKYGYPYTFSVAWAKNQKQEVVDIVKKLLNSPGFNQGLTVSVQSLDFNVLENIKRQNLESSKIEEIFDLCDKSNIPIYTEKIFFLVIFLCFYSLLNNFFEK